MGQRRSGYPRDADDFYREPSWVIDALFDHVDFLPRHIHDGFCGGGTIVDVALRRGYVATGSDKRDRAAGRFGVADYFADFAVHANIVCNPSFACAAEVVEQALACNLPAGGRLALLVPANFIYSVRRYPLFARPEFAQLLVLAKRPSLPPGALLARLGESCRHSGSTDFCWCIWQRGREPGPALIAWASPDGA